MHRQNKEEQLEREEEEEEDNGGEREKALETEFGRIELERALRRTKSKSALGRDSIEYKMIKELLEEWKKKLLDLYNKIFEDGIIPKQ